MKLYKIAQRSGPCIICGIRCNRRKIFTQDKSINNKNSDGNIKTAKEIMQELEKQVEQWKDTPLMHRSCEKRTKNEIRE